MTDEIKSRRAAIGLAAGAAITSVMGQQSDVARTIPIGSQSASFHKIANNCGVPKVDSYWQERSEAEDRLYKTLAPRVFWESRSHNLDKRQLSATHDSIMELKSIRQWAKWQMMNREYEKQQREFDKIRKQIDNIRNLPNALVRSAVDALIAEVTK